MGLEEHQKQVDERTSQFEPQYRPPFEMISAMVEEVWEVAREISHLHWNKKKKPWEETKWLWKELVDMMFTTICMANLHWIDLQKERDEMVDKKLNKRDKDRFEKK